MKKNLFTQTVFTAFLLPLAFQAGAGQEEKHTFKPDNPVLARESADALKERYNSGSHDLVFLENKGMVQDQYGKIRTDIDFSLSGGPGLNVFVGAGRIHYQWSAPVPGSEEKLRMYRMDVVLKGANTGVSAVKELKQDYIVRYFKGASGAIVSESFRKITYPDIYPGIDWVLYVNKEGSLQYDFVVHPGAKASDIRIEFGGAESLKINKDGSLTATTPMGSVTEQPPYSFMTGGVTVPSAFVLKGNAVSFKTGNYSGRLTIDPVVDWISYYGASETDANNQTIFTDMASDETGNLYFVGITRSPTLIATSGQGEYDSEIFISYNPNATAASGILFVDAFIVKFDSTGKRKWASYYGDSLTDAASKVTCDPSGNVYMAGTTMTLGLGHGANVHQTTGDRSKADAFIVKFDSTGNRIWHTYYGGSAEERGLGLVWADPGYLYLAGVTKSATGISDASYNVHQTAITNAQNEAFLAKFDSSGRLIWGTYYGGAGADAAHDLAIDPYGYLYIAGATASAAGITDTNKNVYIKNKPPGFFGSTFLAKFDTTGNRVWGTYYGTGNELYVTIAADPWGHIYMTGSTGMIGAAADSQYFIVEGAAPVYRKQTTAYAADAFLVKFDSSGQAVWGSFTGGTSVAGGSGSESVTCNMYGEVYITGATNNASGVTTSGAYREIFSGGITDAFLMKFDSSGILQYGTYLGDSAQDFRRIIPLTTVHHCMVRTDGFGGVYAAGNTLRKASGFGGLATPGAHQEAYGGGIIFKFLDCPSLPQSPEITGPDTVCVYSEQTYWLPDSSGYVYTWAPDAGWGPGGTAGDTITLIAPGQGGTIAVHATINGTCEKRIVSTETKTRDVYVLPAPDPAIQPVEDTLYTQRAYASYHWVLDGDTISGATGASHIVLENGFYSVIVEDENGCRDTSDTYEVNNVSVQDIHNAQGKVRIYPNPAHTIVYVSASVPVNLLLSGIDGKQLLRREAADQIDISELPAGVYTLSVITADGRLLQVEKLVKAVR